MTADLAEPRGYRGSSDAPSTREDALRRSVDIALTPDRAFALFTDGFATWWPREYSWAGETLDTIAVEAREGGRCFERGPFGFHCDWGRVTVCDPPHRLVFTWQIDFDRTPQPDPTKASEVEVRFLADGASSTRVELEHRGFRRHGRRGDAYRSAMDAPEGWTYILGRYVGAAG